MRYHPIMGLKGRMETHFRKRLKDERDRRGWSQEELARRLSERGVAVHASTIAKIETNARAVRLDEAAAIAELFGLSLDALLGRKAVEDDQAHAMGVVAEEAQRLISDLSQIRARLDRAYQDLDAQFAITSVDGLLDEAMPLQRRRAILMWLAHQLVMYHFSAIIAPLSTVARVPALMPIEITTVTKDLYDMLDRATNIMNRLDEASDAAEAQS
jgi:transcriptional regulator with XRE-family HTH domain